MQEWELQYLYTGKEFQKPPKSLLGLKITSFGELELLDTYFDPPSGVNTAVRLRYCLPDDIYIITVKGPSKLLEHGRVRTEKEITFEQKPSLTQIRSFAHHAGLKLSVAKTLSFNGKLLNQRAWYLYGTHSAGIEIAYDTIYFPNNTIEKRLEVELKGELQFDPDKLVKEITSHFGNAIIPATHSKGHTLRQIINDSIE
jgi:hypothetical protein